MNPNKCPSTPAGCHLLASSRLPSDMPTSPMQTVHAGQRHPGADCQRARRAGGPAPSGRALRGLRAAGRQAQRRGGLPQDLHPRAAAGLREAAGGWHTAGVKWEQGQVSWPHADQSPEPHSPHSRHSPTRTSWRARRAPATAPSPCWAASTTWPGASRLTTHPRGARAVLQLRTMLGLLHMVGLA